MTLNYEKNFAKYPGSTCDCCGRTIFSDFTKFDLIFEEKNITLCEQCKERLHNEIKIMEYREELEEKIK